MGREVMNEKGMDEGQTEEQEREEKPDKHRNPKDELSYKVNHVKEVIVQENETYKLLKEEEKEDKIEEEHIKKNEDQNNNEQYSENKVPPPSINTSTVSSS